MKNIMKKILIIFFCVFSCSLYAQKIYWTDGSAGKIQSANIDGSSGSPFNVASGVSSCFSAATDNTGAGELYWTDFINHTIKKVNLTSLVVTTLVTNAGAGILGVRGIALNIPGNQMFWSDNVTKKIQRSDLNGGSVTTIISAGLVSPGYVAYDPVSAKVYFADNGAGVKKIMRCNADGSTLQDVVIGLNQVWGIAFNNADNCIYWIDSGIDKIQKGNVSSLNVTKVDVITGLTDNIRGLVIDALNNKMYWGDVTTQTIKSANVNGTGVTTLYSSISYPQGLAINWNSALPVELLSFVSTVNRNEVKLDWSTNSELNNSGYDIERTAAGTNSILWAKVGFVEGNGTSSEQKRYSFTDRNLITNVYNYRLKQIDYSGNFKYYDLRSDVTIGIPQSFALHQNYPNPFNPSTKITFELPSDGLVKLIIYDVSGKEVYSAINNYQAGYYSQDINGSNLGSGAYFYKLNFEGSGKSFEKTMKMILVK